MSSLRKIPASQAARGMYVHKLCCSWLENPFWVTSFAIDGEGVLQKILDSGIAELWIDTARGADVAAPGESRPQTGAPPEPSEPSASPAPAPPGFSFAPVQPASMAEELQNAAKLVARSKEAVVSMFNEARMGQLPTW